MSHIEADPPFRFDRQERPSVQYGLARSLTVGDLLGGLRHLLHWIVIATLAGMLIGGAYAMTRERFYQASSTIFIDPRGLEVVDRNLTRQAETSDGNLAWVESQMRVIASREVLDAVIVSQGLEADPEFAEPRKSLRSMISGLLRGGQEKPTSVLAEFSKAVAVQRAQLSYVVEVYVRTRSREKSARLADAIAEAYMASLERNQADLSRRASASLIDRAESFRATVTDANNQVQDFLSRNNIVLTKGLLVSEATLDQTNSLLIQSERTLDEVRARRDQIAAARRNGGIGSVPEILTSPAMTEMRARYQAAIEGREMLAANLLPRHPRMIAANRHVEEARAAVEAEMARIADAAEIDFQRAVAAHAEVRARLSEMESQSFETSEALVRLRELQRNLETKRNVYESYMQRATELAGQEQLPFNASRIISPAMIPQEPNGPGNLLVLMLSTAGGAALGICAVLFHTVFAAVDPHPARTRPRRRSA